MKFRLRTSKNKNVATRCSEFGRNQVKAGNFWIGLLSSDRIYAKCLRKALKRLDQVAGYFPARSSKYSVNRYVFRAFTARSSLQYIPIHVIMNILQTYTEELSDDTRSEA